MARPKKENHPISIRMDKAIYDRLTEFCEVSGQPKTVAIERAISEYTTKDHTGIEEHLLALRQSFPELSATYCMINGAIMKLDEVQRMGFQEFGYRSRINTPLKLYKYFPNTKKIEKDGSEHNYSLNSLENNTVYLQTPTEFDDVFDSDIYLDYQVYEKYRLKTYCQRCQIDVDTIEDSTQALGNALVEKLHAAFQSTGDFIGAFSKEPTSELEKLSTENFCLTIKQELNKKIDFGQAVANAIMCDYEEYSDYLKRTFRISCFTTSPFSQLMWSSYADYHRGFCLEYTIIPNAPQYNEIFYNLFPLIYCRTRPNITEQLVQFQNKRPTDEHLWNIYFHGVLRKGLEWSYQNEWRLLLPFSRSKNEDYNIKFFPITKVYLGNRMQPDARKAIIEICHKKNIPYSGVTRNSFLYEMGECSTLCENCAWLGKK